MINTTNLSAEPDQAQIPIELRGEDARLWTRVENGSRGQVDVGICRMSFTTGLRREAIRLRRAVEPDRCPLGMGRACNYPIGVERHFSSQGMATETPTFGPERAVGGSSRRSVIVMRCRCLPSGGLLVLGFRVAFFEALLELVLR
jgi:hypothetical protein